MNNAKYIYNYNPDYIVSSHYQLLDMIPKDYLSKTIHLQHLSFDVSIKHPATKKAFDKCKELIEQNKKSLYPSSNGLE